MGIFGPPNIEKLKTKKKVKALIKALAYKKDSKVASEDGNVRILAVKALGEIGDEGAVEPLLRILLDRDLAKDYGWGGSQSIKHSLFHALRKIGVPAIKPLVGKLEDVGFSEVLGILKSIEWQPDNSEAGVFYLIAKQEWEQCANMGENAIKPLIIAWGESKGKHERTAAAKVLKQIGKPVIEPLIDFLDQKSKWSSETFDLLKDFEWQPNDSKAGVFYLIAKKEWEKCASMGDIAIQPLIQAWWEFNKSAAIALRQIGAPAIKPLVAFWSSKGYDLRVIKLLKGMEWQPEPSEAGALYCIAEEEWEMCIDMGNVAAQPLLRVLTGDFKFGGDNSYIKRVAKASYVEGAAKALLALYRKGELDDQHKLLLLKQKKFISSHTDSHNHHDKKAEHNDRPGIRKAFSTQYSDCHIDKTVSEHEDRNHTDIGLGLEFPL